MDPEVIVRKAMTTARTEGCTVGQLSKVLHYAGTDSIGDAFSMYAQYFKVFQEYCNNLDHARNRVDACKKLEVLACAWPAHRIDARAERLKCCLLRVGIQARVQAVPGGPTLSRHGSAQLAPEYASRHPGSSRSLRTRTALRILFVPHQDRINI